jgi:hypothetical protein
VWLQLRQLLNMVLSALRYNAADQRHVQIPEGRAGNLCTCAASKLKWLSQWSHWFCVPEITLRKQTTRDGQFPQAAQTSCDSLPFKDTQRSNKMFHLLTNHWQVPATAIE